MINTNRLQEVSIDKKTGNVVNKSGAVLASRGQPGYNRWVNLATPTVPGGIKRQKAMAQSYSRAAAGSYDATKGITAQVGGTPKVAKKKLIPTPTGAPKGHVVVKKQPINPTIAKNVSSKATKRILKKSPIIKPLTRLATIIASKGKKRPALI